MRDLLAVAAGGVIGATARYLVHAWVAHAAGAGFPWATLLVNVAGSLAIGILAPALATPIAADGWQRAFLVVGLLGSFTTFSAFSLDVTVLWNQGRAIAAGAYVAASVTLTVAACLAGLWLGRQLTGSP